MAVDTFNFTTGPSTLQDVGLLSYNGCKFSPLFETRLVGTAVKDGAARTVKLVDYLLTADGYVTLPDGANDISPTMANLRTLLTAQSGQLTYTGRGADIVINPFGGQPGTFDVAWGPVPELIDFQPLGAGRSAKVQWQVKFRIPEIKAAQVNNLKTKLGETIALTPEIPLLQFVYDAAVSYSEDHFSSISVTGTLEIALNRQTSQGTRTVAHTADAYRPEIARRIMAGVDLSRFRVTKRDFNTSRDKRTLEWSFSLEELPYMKLPVGCTVARGNYSVRPARSGAGLVLWLCALRSTYTVRSDYTRRSAWFNFLALLRLRMNQSQRAPDFKDQNPQRGRGGDNDLERRIIQGNIAALRMTAIGDALLDSVKDSGKSLKEILEGPKCVLIDLSYDEGMYLDSKTISFSATWRLVTTLSHILLASGLWTKLPEEDAAGRDLWATTIEEVSKDNSWLENRLDPKLDVIVDFGAQ